VDEWLKEPSSSPDCCFHTVAPFGGVRVVPAVERYERKRAVRVGGYLLKPLRNILPSPKA
jgi:hypothetical protein